MHLLFLSLLLMLSSIAARAGGADTAGLKAACAQLRVALLDRDTIALNRLLHDEASYGHSNGWIEDKAAVKADLYSGKLRYLQIAESDWRLSAGKGVAAVRCRLQVKIELDGQPMEFTLAVLQVWLRKGKRWVLLARQSVKV